MYLKRSFEYYRWINLIGYVRILEHSNGRDRECYGRAAKKRNSVMSAVQRC